MVGNITFPAFLNMAKTIYVEEAERKLIKRDSTARITKSSLALITGIDTRAISQILQTSKEHKEFEAQDLLPEAHVLAKWALDALYGDENSEPMDLPIYGRGTTFQNLVSQTVGRNVTAQTVLDRLVESGNIELLNDNTVRLISRYYFPLSGAKYEMVDVGMFAAANLLSTVQHNVDNRDNPENRLLQQQRWSTTIPATKYEQFKQTVEMLLRGQIDKTLEQIEVYESEDETDPDLMTAGVGFYFFETTGDPEKPN
jgi:hypothetical protein